jgi:DNA-binding CsgD family transcriptional regulator
VIGMSSDFDSIQVIETAYRHDIEDEAWLTALSKSLSSADDSVIGVFTYLYSVRPGEGVDVAARAQHSISPEFVEGLATSLRDAPDAVPRYSIPGSLTADVSVGRALMPSEEEWEEWEEEILGAYPYEHALVLQGWEPSLGHGYNATLVTERPIDTTSAFFDAGGMLACHLSSGLRLRLQGDDAGFLDRADAVFDEDGTLRHAEGEATDERDALRGLVRQLDRIRGRRFDAGDALQMWEALARGRWSLVDVFDTDARRFVVAVRNPRQLEAPRALTGEERRVVLGAALGHSNKLIGYEEGLPESTVATRLAGAMEKLGISTRAELISLLHRFAG